MFSGYFREVAENCALLGCYAASSGNFFKKLAFLAVLRLCILFTLWIFPRFVSLWQRPVGLCEVAGVGDISGYQSGVSETQVVSFSSISGLVEPEE